MSGLTINEKFKLAGIEKYYGQIYLAITANIQTHLNHEQSSYIARDTETALSFQRPALYLGRLNEDGAVESTMIITTANDYLALSFLMFREISGQNAYNFQTKFVVSFKELKVGEKAETYSKFDLFNSFKYSKGGESIEAFLTTKKGTKAVNSEAAKILRAETVEVGQFSRMFFNSFLDGCNALKQATAENIKYICENSSITASPDYFLEVHTCHEIFNLAKDKAFCPDIPDRGL